MKLNNRFLKTLIASMLLTTSLTTWAMNLPQETQKSGDADILGAQLIQAVRNDNYAKVRRLLESNAPVDYSEEHGFTPLHIASRRGNELTAQILLEHHANRNAQAPGKENLFALYLATLKNHPHLVEFLLKNNADVNMKTQNESTALMRAAADGRTAIVQMLLNAKANINIKGPDGTNALILATENGHSQIISLLLEAGANPNTPNDRGVTPLIFAAQEGCTQGVEALLKHNAIINFQASGQSNITALLHAASGGHLEVLKILIKAGAQNYFTDSEGFSPLMYAAQNGHTECVKELVWGNADPFMQAPGTRNTFALLQATIDGHIQAVELLLTEISKADAERIRHNFTGLLAINRMGIKDGASWHIHQWEHQEKEKAPQKNLLLKKPRQLITREILNELIHERMMRVQRMLALEDVNNTTAYNGAQGHNQRELVDLLDPDNACSQERIRTMIENNIKRLLFSPTSKPSGVL